MTNSPHISAAEILARCDQLAAITEEPGRLTRTFLTPAHAQANELVGGWMRAAGMNVGVDAAGNLVGRYSGLDPRAPALMLGSHLDTVRNTGKYDGILGVVACIDQLSKASMRLTHAIDILGFVNEEGTRFGATLTGSRTVAGTFNPADLDTNDTNDVSMRDALMRFGGDPLRITSSAFDPKDVVAYVELHIEQGPVLERENLSVGIVTAISGATRFRVELIGIAEHAGTVPMGQRRDTLARAAEIISYVEKRCGETPGLVGTVGWINAEPGAVNVVPGKTTFSLDIRAEKDADRQAAVADIKAEIALIAIQRGLTHIFIPLHDAPSSICDPRLMAALEVARGKETIPTMRLPSGAGHDAMAIATIAPMAMLFIRCTKGISHNPAEAVLANDVELGARALPFRSGFQI